jgi:NAD(P)H-hydrate epimerase
MRTISREEAKLVDERVAKELGLSTLILMENAGRSVAEEIIKLKKKRVAIFCGKGNNAGDGFVCARHLLSKGLNPDVLLLTEISEIKNEARINLDILLKLKPKIFKINAENFIFYKNKIKNYDLVVDALFGIGLKGEILGLFKEVIEAINSLAKYVVSIDIPSGLDADRGKILGTCIKADKTITFLAVKKGMLINEGPKYCGKIIVKDLGFPFKR